MRAFFFCILVSALFPGRLAAQQPDSSTVSIRTKFSEIQKTLPSCDTVKLEIWDESTEGGEATCYVKDRQVLMIDKWLLGEQYKINTRYYFDNGELIFVLQTLYTYNRPIYYDRKMMEENKDTVFFDDQKTVRSETRFYFRSNKLTRMLEGGKMLKADDPRFKKEEREKTVAAGKLLVALKKKW